MNWLRDRAVIGELPEVRIGYSQGGIFFVSTAWRIDFA